MIRTRWVCQQNMREILMSGALESYQERVRRLNFGWGNEPLLVKFSVSAWALHSKGALCLVGILKWVPTAGKSEEHSSWPLSFHFCHKQSWIIPCVDNFYPLINHHGPRGLLLQKTVKMCDVLPFYFATSYQLTWWLLFQLLIDYTHQNGGYVLWKEWGSKKMNALIYRKGDLWSFTQNRHWRDKSLSAEG